MAFPVDSIATGKSRPRRPELDSLRGLAALSVLFYHALATNSAGLTAGIGLGRVHGWFETLLVYTPLHVIWLGAESVWLFFILSGFVLTRSAMGPGFNWEAYYPSRLARLYVPVFAAIALAWLSYLIPHVPRKGLDPMLPTSYPVASILHDATLLGGTSTSLGVLWSLQWEVLFSLLLPLYILAIRSRAALWIGGAGLVLCVLGWHDLDQVTMYMPMFLFGSLLARFWAPIARSFDMIRRRPVVGNLVGAVLTALGVLGLSSFFLVGPHLGRFHIPAREGTLPAVVLGIVLLVVVVQLWAPLRGLLSWGPAVFLGRISFSLYLVHLPLVILFVYVLGMGGTTAVLSIVAALALAVGFYYAVERPSHRLSRMIGRRIRVGVTERSGRAATARTSAEAEVAGGSLEA